MWSLLYLVVNSPRQCGIRVDLLAIVAVLARERR